MCVYVSVCVRVFVCAYMCVCVRTSVCARVCACVYVCLSTYVHMCSSRMHISPDEGFRGPGPAAEMGLRKHRTVRGPPGDDGGVGGRAVTHLNESEKFFGVDSKTVKRKTHYKRIW